MSELLRETINAAEKVVTGEHSQVEDYLERLLSSPGELRSGEYSQRAYLAALLDFIGLHDESARVLRDAPDAMSRNMEGMLAAANGQHQQARNILMQALDAAAYSPLLRQRILANLAAVSLQTGSVKEAEAWIEAAAVARQAGNPAVDVLIATVRAAIASRRGNLSALRSAATALKEASKSRLAELGTEHPQALTVVANMASAEIMAARAENSAVRLERAIDVLEVTAFRLAAEFGADHPQAKAAMASLAAARAEPAPADAPRPLGHSADVARGRIERERRHPVASPSPREDLASRRRPPGRPEGGHVGPSTRVRARLRKPMGAIRPYLAPPNQETVLHETADNLLAEEGKSVPDWEIVGLEIADEIDRQSGQLLADAWTDYDAFERLRTRAVHAYGRADPVVCVLIGIIAGYLLLVIAGPKFLSLAAASPGLGLTPLILAVLAVAIGIRWALWRRRRTALMRSVSAAYQHWTGVLRDQVLRPFIVEKRNVRNPRLFDASIGEKSPPRLREGSEPRRLVVTKAMTQVRSTARNVHSGSVGVSGPRGVGKSTILEFFGTDTAADDGKDLRLVVPAPVDYEPREFIIHLFSQLCEAVPHGPADRSPIAAETRRHLEQLRYLRTYTTSWSASLTPRSFLTLARRTAKERAEQPFTLPELVDSFRVYSKGVASWQQDAHGAEGRVVIGIDEVDKIRDSDRAEAFLNDIKAIFGVPGCLYLVSLSEDAMADFARRTPSIRSTFDSAFDELVPVGPMTYRHSEQLLFKRVTDVPLPFIALCHVLAGGLPRDLIRAARALIDASPTDGEKSLEDTAGDLIRRELESLRQVSLRQFAENAAPGSLLAALHDREWPGMTPPQFTDAALQIADAARNTESDSARQLCQELVVSLSFYATALHVFSAEQHRLITCLKDRNYAVIDDLAAARYAMRVNGGLAHKLLEQYRRQSGMEWSDDAK